MVKAKHVPAQMTDHDILSLVLLPYPHKSNAYSKPANTEVNVPPKEGHLGADVRSQNFNVVRDLHSEGVNDVSSTKTNTPSAT